MMVNKIFMNSLFYSSCFTKLIPYSFYYIFCGSNVFITATYFLYIPFKKFHCGKKKT